MLSQWDRGAHLIEPNTPLMNPEGEFQAPSVPADGALRRHQTVLDDTRTLPRVSAQAVPAERPASVPAALVDMLLPSERLTFASRPHAIVLLRPAISLSIIAIVLVVALTLRVHPIAHGHHTNVPWLDARFRIVAWAIGAALLLRGLCSLAGAVTYYLGFRIVTTNRRVFVVDGLLGRRIAPLGNTAMAGSTLLQGPLGRILGFGSIASGSGTIRDMKEPVLLYREFHAVANGVDGDQWTQAIRQTQIP